MLKKPKPTPEEQRRRERIYQLRRLRIQSIEQARRLNRQYEYLTIDKVPW